MKQITRITLIWMTILLVSFNAQSQTKKDSTEQFVFRHANVITMETEEILTKYTVVVEGDRIKEIVPDSLYVANSETTTVDASNQYIIPGLIDMHAHIIEEFRGSILADAPQYLLYGVTSIYNLIGRKRHLSIRDSIRQGLWTALDPDLASSSFAHIAPDVFTTGWDTNEPHFYTPDEIEATVREQKALGFDGIKMHDHLSDESFKRLHEVAREVGIKVIGHAPRNLGMNPVYEQKHDLAHAEEYMYAAFSDIETNRFQYSAKFFILVWFTLIILLSRIGFLKLKRLIKKSELPVSDSLTLNKTLGKIAILSTIFILGYFFSTPPNAPFLMDFPLTKPLLTIVAVFIIVYVAKFIFALYKNNPFKKSRYKTLSIWILGSALVICSVISIYWIEIIWRTTDQNMEKVAQDTADADIWVTPNLVTYEELGKGLRKAHLEKKQQSQDFKYLPRDVRGFWINFNDHPDQPKNHKLKVALGEIVEPGFRNQMDFMKRFIEKLHKKNVRLLAGTDTGLNWIFPGVSMHEELELLVSCGLSPYEALKTATSNPADYFEIPNEIGRIKVNARADFLLLNHNPLENIHNSRSIDGVMMRGEWFDRNRLEQLKKELIQIRK